MIVRENIDNTFERIYSNQGVYIHGGYPESNYDVVYDPFGLNRTYTETDIPIGTLPGHRELSKRKLMNNLKEMNLWNQTKAFMESNGYWDDWDAATTLDEDEELMQTAIVALKSALGVTSEQIEELIAASTIAK